MPSVEVEADRNAGALPPTVELLATAMLSRDAAKKNLPVTVPEDLRKFTKFG